MSDTAFFIVIGLLSLGTIALAMFRFRWFLTVFGVTFILSAMTLGNGARAIVDGDVEAITRIAVFMIFLGILPIYYGTRRKRHVVDKGKTHVGLRDEKLV